MDDFDNDAPPPYSEHDPLQSQPPQLHHSNTQTSQEQYDSTMGTQQTPISESSTISSQSGPVPSIPPSTFASAARYFAERSSSSSPPQQQQGELLVHTLTIYPRSQGKDFPHRPRCWNQRAQDINQHDWDTFLRFLFPPHLGLAASSPHLSRQVRSEIRRDRKDRPQETDGERRARIAAVIAEWNDGFFAPRGAAIWWVYVADPESGPVSPLCPRCYPAATQAASQGQPRSTDSPIPVDGAGAGVQGERHSQFQPPFSFGEGGVGADQSPFDASDMARQHPIGSAGWAALISARAKQYADLLAQQAQQYGKRIEENSMARGRWAETQAKMKGRQIEEMGKAIGNYWASVGDTIAREAQTASWGAAAGGGMRGRALGTGCPMQARGFHSGPAARADPGQQAWSGNVDIGGPGMPPQRQGTRRRSLCSSKSSESLSSIDSLSSVSDLDPAELAAARAQLLSLNDHHDRELHAAATGIRAQLRDLQQERRDARIQSHRDAGPFRGRHFGGPRGGGFGWERGLFAGRGGPHQHLHAASHRLGGGPWGRGGHGFARGPGGGRGGGWGRWDSPEDLQRRDDIRQNLKEETKLLKEAFRGVGRRAKREAKEARKEARREIRDERRRR